MVELRADPAAKPGWATRAGRLLSLDWGPRTFVLVPGERHLSAEHLAYAYHSVAQRFLFILTDEARPLPRTTIALLFFPAAVATTNLGTDLYDLYRYGNELAPMARTLIAVEAILLVLLTLPITFRITKLAALTATLLHGWKLAVSEAWMEQWNEKNEDPAAPVYVDTTAEKPLVRPVTDEERARCDLPKRSPWPAT